MNAILEKMYEVRGGHYCHALEVENSIDLEMTIEAIYQEFEGDYSLEEIIGFCESLELYCLNDDEAMDVYNYNIAEQLKSY